MWGVECAHQPDMCPQETEQEQLKLVLLDVGRIRLTRALLFEWGCGECGVHTRSRRMRGRCGFVKGTNKQPITHAPSPPAGIRASWREFGA